MLRLRKSEVVFHCRRHLHLQFLVHLPTQLVPEEQHHKGTSAEQQCHHHEVEEGADDLGEDSSGLYHNPAAALLVKA